ncbi:helix-turn-helix domain-containing protein [Alicyclobacillus dauci]|uniref:Helix-turn-helix domain-containing protein n=1 Tax=Alicyclobacillus dauci TaxID=1475485 RepID=A0ABY6Z551_9BACL|nr:helix-turn-helix transcriptional regulator [Alicyclobacillus dauci]WAH37870.1 helix-turn-helix domain-containing protein [Alicyclobacillus dauci]
MSFYTIPEDDDDVELGQKLRILREQKSWTLAQASEFAGISLSHLSAIENGTRPNPSFFVVVKLAQAYGVPLEYFLDRPENDPDDDLQVASEATQTYQEIAKRLVEDKALDDPSKLLEAIAKYLRDRSAKYDHDN